LRKLYVYSMLIIALIFLGLGWSLFQYHSITQVGEVEDLRNADVIIILGAGVWENGPSPALRARTNHAAELLKKGYAEHVILSGGLGDYPPSEAEAMKGILLQLGISPEQLFLEDQAINTVENIKYSKEIMDQQGWKTALIVSDTFHLKRALFVAQDYGIEAFGAPAKNSVLYQNKSLRVSYTLREVAAISKYHTIRWF
jgi:uncharacterized SAM-binding protein YcdF (DUF218 family)